MSLAGMAKGEGPAPPLESIEVSPADTERIWKELRRIAWLRIKGTCITNTEGEIPPIGACIGVTAHRKGGFVHPLTHPCKRLIEARRDVLGALPLSQ